VNLLLFDANQRNDDGTLTISGRQHLHLQQTLRAKPGDTLRVGAIDGLLGSATVLQMDNQAARLEVVLDRQPPPPLPLTMVLALPRPKMMRRILQTTASLGVKTLHLINSYRVDKSFWGTPWLAADAIREQLWLGLEQAADTVFPQVHLHQLFKPFVEDQLPALAADTLALVAHPYGDQPCPAGIHQATTLAIGPEGGFIPYEIDKLRECGFAPVTLGPRILRVETAIPVLVARLFH
jgi:RsmE family RNA methyltransferase